MIRDAKEADIPRLVEMGISFLKDSEYKACIRSNPDQQTNLMAMLIAEGRGVLLVDECDDGLIGMVGSFVYPHLISGDQFAAEVFLWIEPGHRGRGRDLVRECEKKAKSIGAKYSQMTAPNERVGKFYKALGYNVLETQYQKAL